MPYTRADLVNEALMNLGVLSEGEDAQDEDYARVDNKVDAVVALLRDTDVYFLADADAVPDNALLPLGHYLAGACAASFGQQTDQALLNWAQWGREQLLILDSEPPHYTPLEVQAY